MPKKVFTPEQVVAKLRAIEVALAHGKLVSLACREAGIVDASYYRWRKEYSGLYADGQQMPMIQLIHLPSTKPR